MTETPNLVETLPGVPVTELADDYGRFSRLRRCAVGIGRSPEALGRSFLGLSKRYGFVRVSSCQKCCGPGVSDSSFSVAEAMNPGTSMWSARRNRRSFGWSRLSWWSLGAFGVTS